MSQQEIFDWGDGTNLTVSADSFEGDQSLTLTTGVNTGTSNRSKDIAIVSTDGSVTSVIQFTQLASAYSYVFNLQPAGSVNFTAAGGSVSVGNTLQIYQNGELLRSEENVSCDYTLSPSSPLSLSTESGSCTVTAPSLGLSLSPAGTYTLTGSFASEETGELVSAELILTQEANLIEAITVTSEDVSLNYAEIPAGGGSSSPQLSSEPAVSILFTSGDSGAPASITIPDGSGVLTIGIQSYQMDVDTTFTMEDDTSGTVSAPSRAAVMGDVLTSPVVSADYVAQWQPADADYGEPVSGDSISLTAYVTQAANIVTGVSVDLSGGSFSLEYAEVPAAGGTATPTLNVPADVVLSYIWASGDTTSDTPPQATVSYSALSYTGTSSDGFSMDDASFATTGSVVVSSRGSIIGEARQSSEVTASSVVLTVSWASVEYASSVQSDSLGSASGVVTQAANIIESYEIMGSSWDIPATSTFSAGGSSASYTNSCTFSSGVVKEFTDVESISWGLSGDFGTLETPTLLDITDWMCTVIAASRGTVVGEALTATLTLRITGSAQESATLTLTQARNNVVSAVCCTPEGDAFDSVVGPLSASGSEFAFSTIATFTSGATAQGVLPLPSSAESTAAWLSATDTVVTVASCGSVISDERQGVLTFTSESTGGFASVSFSLTVAQEANVLLSSQLRVDPVTTVVSAAGGSVQLVCKSENIYTSGADVHTVVTEDCSFVVSDADGSGVTVSETGVVSFPSRGTVEGGAYTATIQASYNSDSATVEVSQEANAVTVSEVTIQSGSFDGVVPAGGGTTTLTFVAQATLSYTSGSTQSVSNSEQQGLWSASAEAQDASWVSVGDVTGTGEADFTVASRGTAVGDIREASVQLTVSFSTVSGTASYTLQQAANQVESAAIDITSFDYGIMAATATQSGLPSITETLTYTYSSGATASSQDPISHAFAITPMVSGASISQEGVVSWSANEGAEARSLTVELTSTISNSRVSASDTATALLTQTAGTVTYGDVQVSLSYSDIPASGGTVQPVLSYSQTFGYNGSTTGGGVITSGGAVSYSGGSVSEDGSVSASSLGTTAQARSEVTTVTVTVALNGQEGSASVQVYQAANAVVSYGTPVVSVSYATVPASGGTATPTGSYTQTATYTSGGQASLTTGGVWSYSGGGVDSATGTLQVASLGTTVKDISSIATVTATVTMNGKSGSKQVDILQAANAATYATPEVSLSYQDIPASGGSVSPTLSYSQSVSYTSGASRSITSGGSVSYSGSGVGATTGSVSASTLGTVVKSRTQITTASVSVVLNGKTGTDTAAVYQAANAVVSYSKPVVSLSYSVIPARGGSVSPTVGCTQQATYTSGVSAGVSTTGATYVYSGSGVSTGTGQVTAQSLGVTVTSAQTLITSVTVTCTLNGQSGTASAQVYQAVNSVSYSDVNITSFTYAGIPASGGSVSPSLSYSQTATYSSGSTRSITSGGSVSYSGTSVNTTSGAVSAASKGTAISNTTTVTTATVSVSLNGKSGSKSAVVQQSGNYVVGLDIRGGSFSYADISAGATSAAPTVIGTSVYFIFSSGSESGSQPASTYGAYVASVSYTLGSVINGFTAVSAYSGTLTATSRGTTIGAARTSGVVTRKVMVTWTPTSSYNAAGIQTDTDSKTATCTQALNTVTSIALYTSGATVTPPKTDYPASGTFHGYVGIPTYSSGASGGMQNFEGYVSYSFSESWGHWEISPDGYYYGILSVSSRGTVAGAARSGELTCTLAGTINGVSVNKSGSLTITQAANTQTAVYDSPTVSLSVSDIPAAGGVVSSGTVSYSQKWRYSYTSGSVSEQTAKTTGGSVTYSTAVSASSLGTTIKGRTQVGTLTATVTMNGKSGKGSAVVQQSGNYVVGLDIRGGSFSYADISAGATSAAPTVIGTSVYFIFSSGSESGSQPASTYGAYVASVSYTLGSVINGFTAVSAYSGTLTATSRGTTIGAARTSGVVTRKVMVTWTPTSSYNAAGIQTDTDSKTATCTQALNTVTSIALYTSGATVTPPKTDYPASGTFHGYVGIPTYSSGASGGMQNFEGYVSYSFSESWGHWEISPDGYYYGILSVSSRGTVAGAARSGELTCTLAGTINGVSVNKSGSLTITQAANTQTAVYDSPTVSLSVSDIPAAGGVVSSGTVSYSQKWRYSYTSGSVSEQTAKTTGGSVTYSTAVSASSLGTTIKGRTQVGTLTATVTMNGKSGKGSAVVYQAANAITGYGVPTGRTLSVADIPAKGGSVSSGTVGGTITQTRTYTSGSTDTLTNPTVSATSYSAAVSAPSLGTTVKSRTQVGTLTHYYTCNGKQGSVSATVYQAANAATTISYGSWVISVSANRYTSSASACPASGGTATITRSASRTRTQNYTSGATSALSAETATPTLSISGAGFSLNGTTVTIASRSSTIGAARTATVTVTHSGVSKSVTLYQALNTVTSIDIRACAGATEPPTVSYPAAGAAYCFSFSCRFSSGLDLESSVVDGLETWSFDQSWGSWAATPENRWWGVLTIPSRGTTIGASRSGTLTCTVKGTINGVSINASDSVTITQALNKMTSITEVKSNVTYSPTTLSAAGGNSTPSYTGDCTLTFSSGSTTTYRPSGWYGMKISRSWSLSSVTGFSINTDSGIVTAASRGTTIGAARSTVANAKLTFSYTNPSTVGGDTVTGTGTDNITITQAANVKSYDYTDLQGHIGSTSWPAQSDYTTFWATGNYVERYTSGATGASGSGSVPWDSVNIPVSWVTYSAENGHLTWGTNTGAERSTTITGRIGSWTYPVSVTQRGGAVTGILYIRFPSNTTMGFIPQWRITVRTSAGGQLWGGSASETGQTGGAYTIRLPDEAVSAINNDTSGTIVISCTYATSGRYYTGSPTGTELNELRSGGTIYVDVSPI